MLFLVNKTFFFVLCVSLLFFSCTSSTPEVIMDEQIQPVEAIPVSFVEDIPSDTPSPSPLPEIEEIIEIEEVSPIVDEEPVEVEPVPSEEDIPEADNPDKAVELEEPVQEQDEEYLRSISSLSGTDAVAISPEVFEDDKNQIFQIINDLDRIMKKKDFNAWLSYLTPESEEYWTNRHNLLELSRHLFSSDDFHINNIREYFEMFFIPARRGRIVDEIRYVTPDYVKVVQYKNKTDVIYYFFDKQDDIWKLKLDTLDN